MPALSVMDLAMFVLESPQRTLNIGPLVILTPPAGFRGNFADRLHAKLLKRPPGPPFNYRLRLSLTSLPSVEPVADPDITGHVHRLTLASASMEDLLAKVCELHEPLLDRSGLLWQFWVIDGLADGRVALYGKVHHGLIDGRTFVNAMMNCVASDPKDMKVRAMWEGVARARAKEAAPATLAGRLLAAGGQAAGLARSVAGVYGLLARQGLRTLGIGEASPLPFSRVTSAFDGPASAKRSYAFCTLPLDDLRALGKAHGATVNDLLLTVLDMGLHRYLGKRGKALRAPLVADMPVALKDDGRGGNKIAVLQLPLGRTGASPRERLREIRNETRQIKAEVKQWPGETLILHSTLVHALPMLLERAGVKKALRLSNLMVSNPFGFEGKSYVMGATVDLALPMSVIVAGYKLNVTAVTLADRLQIGFIAIPDAVPRVARLARATEQAFDELKAALDAHSDVAAAPRRAARKRAVGPKKATAAKAVAAATKRPETPAVRRRTAPAARTAGTAAAT